MLNWFRKPSTQICMGASLLLLFHTEHLETAYAESTHQFGAEVTRQAASSDVDVRSSITIDRNRSSDETFASVINTMKDTINRGQQSLVRGNLGVTRKEQEQQITRDIQNDFSQASKNTPHQKWGDTNLIDLINHQYNLSQGARDPAQNAIMQDILKNGDGLQITHDHGVKLAILGREFDKMSKEYEDQGILEKGADILGTLVPLRAELSALNAYKAKSSVFSDYSPSADTDTVKGRLGELLNPGDALQAQIDQLMLLPLSEFKKAVPGVIQKVKENSSLYPGVPNLLIAKEALSHYVMGLSDSEKMDYNVRSALQILLGIGFLTLTVYGCAHYFGLPFQRSAFPDLPINKTLGKQIPLFGKATMSKAVLVGATSVVALSVLFPPTTEIRMTLGFFAGWHPLWKMGLVPDRFSTYEIAYPMLLVEWALIALFAFTLNTLSADRESDSR